MGLGRALSTRSTQYVATNTVTGASQTFTIVDNLAPDWITSAYRGGMSIPGAWRASTLLSNLLGSLPFHAYRDRAGQPTERIPSLLLDQPNPPDTRMVSFSSLALDYLWEGNAVALIAARSPLGWPTAMIPVPAANVGVRRVSASWPSRIGIPEGELEYQIGGSFFGSDEVLHIKGPCQPGALRGLGVLEAHLSTLELAREQQRQASSISRHGVPTGVIEVDDPDLTAAEATDLKAGWMRSQRDRSVAVLNGMKFTPLSWNPDELQLVEARKFTLTDVENIFGLPIGMLGGNTSSRTYSNIEQEGVNLLKFTLFDPVTRFEQALSLLHPRGTYVKATMDAVLRSDTLARYQAYQIGLAAGFLTTDEVRAHEELPPLAATGDEMSPRQLAEMIQKIYLGVGKVISADEARAILNSAGANLLGDFKAEPTTPGGFQ